MAYWRFQKYQTEVTNFAPRLGGPTAECFQLQGASPSEPLTRGSAPRPRWGLCLQTAVTGSRSALAMSPTRAFCLPHCFRPGDAPAWTSYPYPTRPVRHLPVPDPYPRVRFTPGIPAGTSRPAHLY